MSQAGLDTTSGAPGTDEAPQLVVLAHPLTPARLDDSAAVANPKAMFDAAGFEVIGTTKAVASGMPRPVMRHTF